MHLKCYYKNYKQCISTKILTPTQISNIKLFEQVYDLLDNNDIDSAMFEEEEEEIEEEIEEW